MLGPKLKLQLRIQGGLSGRTELQNKLVMTSPLASTEDDVQKNASYLRRDQGSSLDRALLSEVATYVSTENQQKPYSDNTILSHLQGLGYDALERRDVTVARETLGIASSLQRKLDYKS